MTAENKAAVLAPCSKCQGRGKRSRRVRKKVRLSYLKALAEFEKAGSIGEPPERPKGHLDDCVDCSGSGLVTAQQWLEPDHENLPHVAIVGGGIGGVALAVACRHRGIPFTLYERDEVFAARSQGYGLTLQQASKAIEGFGLFDLPDGVVSTRHLVHNTQGKVLGEWGMRKWLAGENASTPKRTNIHIARQSLRAALLEQLGGDDQVSWGYQLLETRQQDGGVELDFLVNGQVQTAKADLLVGADGIRSVVRQHLVPEDLAPLRYLGCMVILGICPLVNLNGLQHELLDGATVFQTANGNERIYMMPFTADSVMWQLSFPMSEDEAKLLSQQGAQALKAEACRRTQWHDPIPTIMKATDASLVSGYPVYDRSMLQPQWLQQGVHTTLIGDAAHPMSPFKGQGANQALLDALSLARSLYQGCGPYSNWREVGIRQSVLNDYEAEMLARSEVKVRGSAQAAEFLHSDIVLYEGDEPRGRCLDR